MDKIIKALELCISNIPPQNKCPTCPYRSADDDVDCVDGLMKDALKILKEYKAHLEQDIADKQKEIERLNMELGFSIINNFNIKGIN